MRVEIGPTPQERLDAEGCEKRTVVGDVANGGGLFSVLAASGEDSELVGAIR